MSTSHLCLPWSLVMRTNPSKSSHAPVMLRLRLLLYSLVMPWCLLTSMETSCSLIHRLSFNLIWKACGNGVISSTPCINQHPGLLHSLVVPVSQFVCRKERKDRKETLSAISLSIHSALHSRSSSHVVPTTEP